MAQRPTQTTESGSPVTDHQNEFDYVVSGAIGPQAYAHHAEDDDFVQAGMLFRVMKEDARQRLIDNVAGSLAQVSRPDVVERSIEHFRKADPEYGRRLSEAAMESHALNLVRAAFQQARTGDAAGLAVSLDFGVPPDVCNEKGDSLLMLAAYHGHREAARVLLSRGADPELRNARRQTPLDGVAFKGDLAMAELLLDHGAAPDGRGSAGHTPLMFAAMFDHVGVVELLLSRGASADRRDGKGATALDLAQGMGALRAVARLGRLSSSAPSPPSP